MNILILNCILATAQKGIIPTRASIKDTMIYNFACGFLKNGHNVTLIASEEFCPTTNETYDFEIIYLKSFLPNIFKPSLLPYPKGLRRYIKSNINQIDLIISSEAFSIGTLLASGICKDKLIIWQEMDCHQKLFFKIPARIWYNCVIPLFLKKRLIVARSEPAKQFILKYTKNVTAEIVDHGINGDLFKPSNISDNSFVIISQLIPRKNISSIITIFSNFVNVQDYADYKLHIIGDGEEYELLKNLVEQLKLQNKVILHGFMTHDKMRDYLRAAKATLINTYRDNNMVSISESILSGTPIITNTVPTNSSFINDNGLGVVKDNWDYNDLIEIITNYDTYHKNCIEKRDQLTNVGATKTMLDIYSNWKNK